MIPSPEMRRSLEDESGSPAEDAVWISRLDYAPAPTSAVSTEHVLLELTASPPILETAFDLDLCLMDASGAAHYANAAVRLNSGFASLRFEFDRLPRGPCQGYVLLRSRGERIELLKIAEVAN